jgi:hypothetical protein
LIRTLQFAASTSPPASQTTGTRRRRPLRNGSSELPTIPADSELPLQPQPQPSNSLLPALDLVNFRSAFGSSLDLAAQAQQTPTTEQGDETLGDETVTLKNQPKLTDDSEPSDEAPDSAEESNTDEEEQSIRLVGGVAL